MVYQARITSVGMVYQARITSVGIVPVIFFLASVCEGTLYGVGCEDGWMDHGYYCYLFGVKETMFQNAMEICESAGGDLASVWSAEERKFIIDKLWQPKVSADKFAWFGLYGNNDNSWAYLDGSTVTMSGGVLTSSTGAPADKTNKCGAFRGSGNLAFLDCSAMTAQAYICKKALARVFATSSLLNHTLPANSIAKGAQLFERVWPPVLPSLPPVSHYMAEDDTDSETGCAYRCHSVPGCKAFQVTCIAADMCKSLTCILLTQI